MRYTKFWVQALVSVLAAVIPALTAPEMTAAVWINVVILAAGAVMVMNASNDVPGWGYAKLVAASISAVAVVLVSALSDGGVSGAEVVQMIVAAAGALGVGVFPNAETSAPPHVV